MKRWLVSLDMDHVKEYIFATGRLREITGASALLDRLNRQETKKLIGGGRQVVLGGNLV